MLEFASHLTSSLGRRIPGRTKIRLVWLLLLPLSVTSCTAHYSIHPGALSKIDSVAYDALLIAETTIDQARQEYQAGHLPAEAKEALDALIDSYNVARDAWRIYRAAIANNVPSPIDFDQLTKDLLDLTNAVRRLKEVITK
jgi:hypothetical protein